jgi:hypothetical protein
MNKAPQNSQKDKNSKTSTKAGTKVNACTVADKIFEL